MCFDWVRVTLCSFYSSDGSSVMLVLIRAN